MNNLIRKGKDILIGEQANIMSAAAIIMMMVILARLLGLVRLRVLAYFFVDEKLSLFFAAFMLPDMIFEVLTLGALSSAFIPVFTKTLKKDSKLAWEISGVVVNLGIIIFLVTVVIFGALAGPLYKLVAPGYSGSEIAEIARMSRILFAAQGLFIVSYVMTGVLESSRRFLIPALAPAFYNLGIILGIVFLSPSWGLYGPVWGVVIGAGLHLGIQLPFAYRFGFRFVPYIKITDEVRRIGKLAFPRMIELSFFQLAGASELFLASLISTAAFAHYNLAFSVQALPVGLFGLSLAKAALPTLSRETDNPKAFRRTLFGTLYQILFLVIPISVTMIVLRIPIIRLLYGTSIFDWEATVQTGLTLSWFAVGIPFQAAVVLLTRAYYAYHNTKLPVVISIVGTSLTIIFSVVLVLVFKVPTWGLALGYALGQIFQCLSLIWFLKRHINEKMNLSFMPIAKASFSGLFAGMTMFVILKLFDKSVWVKQLSLLNVVDYRGGVIFENLVLDTRYTVNLIILSGVVVFIGMSIYLLSSFILGSAELAGVWRFLVKHNFRFDKNKPKEQLVTVNEEG